VTLKFPGLARKINRVLDLVIGLPLNVQIQAGYVCEILFANVPAALEHILALNAGESDATGRQIQGRSSPR
jgi:hypothetical protein